MMTIEDLIRGGRFYSAREDWEEYGDTTKMLNFIQEHGVKTGHEANKLAELLQPLKPTGKRRITKKTRNIIEAIKACRLRQKIEKEFYPRDYPSLEETYNRIGLELGVTGEAVKKIAQKEGLTKKG